ncbi:hypothetical protein Tco_0910921 [Tanacetum coccineum]|uniref:Uncharacterized protein n=1 Tax=Tanacetum coccineum TaxID=301880 RepID=A0ABQ5CXH4_9ASTR
MRCSPKKSRCYRSSLDVQRRSGDAIVVHEMFNRGVEMLSLGVEMLSLYIRCSTDRLRCYRYTLDVQQRSRDDIVVHEMFNGRVDMLSLYMRCSTDESRGEKKQSVLFCGRNLKQVSHPSDFLLCFFGVNPQAIEKLGKVRECTWTLKQAGWNSRVDEMILARVSSSFAGGKYGKTSKLYLGFWGGKDGFLGK